MIGENYQTKIRNILKKRLGDEARFFIFGSSLGEGKFSDVDVAIDGEIENEKNIFLAKDDLEESDLPYKFDLVYLKKTEKSFQDKILNGKILWLT
jgi:predicted nucleotidyltransferase